eukprot:7877638-Pyramimonas_sp.AAC.1
MPRAAEPVETPGDKPAQLRQYQHIRVRWERRKLLGLTPRPRGDAERARAAPVWRRAGCI